MFAEEDGVYSREDETTLQTYFSAESFASCARKAGFTQIFVYGEKDFSPLTETNEKMYIVLK